jgi:hypothetical protein
MRKILIIVMLCVGFGASAQEVYTSSGKPANAKKKEKKPEGFDISRLIVGGGIGLGFGTVTTVSVSPIVGYRITDKLSAGVGFGYQYLKVKDFFEVQDINPPYGYQYYDYKASIISASVWARYLILTNLFAQVEYEHNFMSYTEPRFSQSGSGAIENTKTKYNAPSVLVGIGYRQPITDNSSLYIMGMYDVLQNELSPYYGRIFPRIGFNIGF